MSAASRDGSPPCGLVAPLLRAFSMLYVQAKTVATAAPTKNSPMSPRHTLHPVLSVSLRVTAAPRNVRAAVQKPPAILPASRCAGSQSLIRRQQTTGEVPVRTASPIKPHGVISQRVATPLGQIPTACQKQQETSQKRNPYSAQVAEASPSHLLDCEWTLPLPERRFAGAAPAKQVTTRVPRCQRYCVFYSFHVIIFDANARCHRYLLC